jgi:YfiH family protein
MNLDSANFVVIPEWEKIPSLVHGFGNKDWQSADFEAHPRLRNFKLLSMHQIHSDILHIVHDVPEEPLAGDALLTDLRDILLVIKTADCLPILIVDPKIQAIAAVHCGWRSTSQGLVQKVVRRLEEHFQCAPSFLLVAFGPCIGKDCYEVGEDVRKKFEEEGVKHDVFIPHPLRTDTLCLDLRMANRHQLMDVGVKDANISQINLCTHCREDLYSYRRSQQTEGRMLSFVGIMSS